MSTKKFHFIGIGGIGMSGLAKLMLSKNTAVSGSDIASTAVTEALKQSGATIFQGHSSTHISPDMTVIYSTDIKKDNPEYQTAVKYQCPMLHRSELLQQLMKGHSALAVAGTHGKTTTASLLTWVLESSGNHPSYAIGGIVPQLSSNAGQGQGKYFVAEACESDGTFLKYTPFGAIVTNVDFDHMDYYVTEKALKEAFKQFIENVSSSKHLFWCADDPHLSQMKPSGISYGFAPHCKLKASNFRQNDWNISFDIEFEGKKYSQVEVSLTGKHNALNALAVFGLSLSLGISEQQIRNALKSFKGVLRRCEKKGQINEILFIDDYGHHPTELKATLKAIRGAIGERRLIAIYQPHRYSRAKECMGMYSGVFDEADHLFITEIYASREQPIPGVTHEKIIEEIRCKLKERCQFVPREQVASQMCSFLRPHDVVITLGAGDITKASGEILAQLNLKGTTKLKVGAIFGGASVEHEVSLLSATRILNSLNSNLYEIECFGITPKGFWLFGPDAKQRLEKGEEYAGQSKMSSKVLEKLIQCDILFPILHGTYAEDGTIQGLFEILGKAYVGCDCRSGAISMDKVITKKLALQEGIPTAPFIAFSRSEWNNHSEEILKKIQKTLRYPLFAKPTHLGSSIGVHKVNHEAELVPAINDAFRFDTNVLVENGIDGREIEFSVVGTDHVTVFPPGEVYTEGKVYDYESKYSPTGAPTTPKAQLSQEIIDQGIDLVKRTYTTVGCIGMARIDTFLDKQNKFWLNEINPIPGFTNNSLFPKMCISNGLNLPELMDQLIIQGLSRRRQLDNLEVKP